VELLCKSAHLAEKEATAITIELVDRAMDEIERDKYVAMVKASPKQLQAVLFAIIAPPHLSGKALHTGDAYERYRNFCNQIGLRALTQRAFSDLLSELDMCGFIQARVKSHGRYGRTKEIHVHLPADMIEKLKQVVLMEFDLNPR
jgi:cell division control protein 6